MKIQKRVKLSIAALFTFAVIGVVYALHPLDYIHEWESQSSTYKGTMIPLGGPCCASYVVLYSDSYGDKWVMKYRYFQYSSGYGYTHGNEMSTHERLNDWKSRMGLCTEDDDCTNQVGDESTY